MRGVFQQGWLWLSKFIVDVIIEVSAIALNSCLEHYSMGVFSTLITVLQYISVKSPSIPQAGKIILSRKGEY
jgi:hypothetical protein